MPSSTSSGVKTYKPLAPPKEQVTFAPRRRTAKPNATIPKLDKDQSSLTQGGIDWVKTPSRNYITISSDVEDEEYTDRPAKRRKRSSEPLSRRKRKGKFDAREPDQSSFTQYVRDARRPALGDNGFKIWQDASSEDELEDIDVGPVISKGQPSMPALPADQDTESQAEIPESSQADHPQKRHNNSDAGRSPIRPLQTPQKVRFAELPSSHTSRSSKYRSPRRNDVIRSPLKERSSNVRTPMKTPQSPKSQTTAMKMFEQVRREQAQRKKASIAEAPVAFNEDLEQCAAEATDQFSLRTQAMLPPPRKLERKTTVQDSQSEESALADEAFNGFSNSRESSLLHDIDVVDSQKDDAEQSETQATVVKNTAGPTLKRKTTVDDSQVADEVIAEDSYRPPRTLKRITTIQDSDVSDDELEVEHEISKQPIVSGQPDCSQHPDDVELQSYDDILEGTFNPVFSALDRDATRFGWTQTQRSAFANSHSQIADDDDLDYAHSAHVPRRDTLSSSRGRSPEMGAPLPLQAEPSTNPAAHTNMPASTKDGIPDDSAYESCDQSRVGAVEVPSSPPLLQRSQLHHRISHDNLEQAEASPSPSPPRPSQVSTVVPTQLSPQRPSPPSSPYRHIKPEPLTFPRSPNIRRDAQDCGSPGSPGEDEFHWPSDSMTDSALPLPPWSSPGRHGFGNGDGYRGGANLRSEPQMESLADFSLPPPPPMSSSIWGTPASSDLN